eukprot:1635437-Rhodomonas_salina.2
MDEEASSQAATQPATTTWSISDMACDEEAAALDWPKLSKLPPTSRETRSTSRAGAKPGELTESSVTGEPLGSLCELADLVLRLSRDNSVISRAETESRQLRQRAQKLGAVTDEPPPTSTELKSTTKQHKTWTN